jgi:Family of unknown function (DUF6152)
MQKGASQMKRALCALLLTAVAGTSVIAHHSYAAYDRERVIDVEGDVESFEWISPHSVGSNRYPMSRIVWM